MSLVEETGFNIQAKKLSCDRGRMTPRYKGRTDILRLGKPSWLAPALIGVNLPPFQTSRQPKTGKTNSKPQAFKHRGSRTAGKSKNSRGFQTAQKRMLEGTVSFMRPGLLSKKKTHRGAPENVLGKRASESSM